jgi:hypothetical protein
MHIFSESDLVVVFEWQRVRGLYGWSQPPLVQSRAESSAARGAFALAERRRALPAEAPKSGGARSGARAPPYEGGDAGQQPTHIQECSQRGFGVSLGQKTEIRWFRSEFSLFHTHALVAETWDRVRGLCFAHGIEQRVRGLYGWSQPPLVQSRAESSAARGAFALAERRRALPAEAPKSGGARSGARAPPYEGGDAGQQPTHIQECSQKGFFHILVLDLLATSRLRSKRSAQKYWRLKHHVVQLATSRLRW